MSVKDVPGLLLTISPSVQDMHLIIFDVDGTLTRSSAVDSTCYARAMAEQLHLQISTDWSSYRHSTDSGVLRELLDRHEIAETPGLIDAIRSHFVRLLSEAFDTDPTCCREVPGAGALIECLRATPGVRLAIATGGWASSGRLKLRQAGVNVDQLAFASSDDSFSREGILRTAQERAAAEVATRFKAVTYVGDALWDLLAANALGFHFIGVACDGDRSRLRSAGAASVFRDFTNRDAFIGKLLAV
jgi:phosphoglycolate phosphatase-like HAD superfamily hydrolase